ncbi:hypothetical protein PSQ90_00885 [Devosia rhodophyticola]|uniref:PIN domain-containing protein n=1 Tax=Devosia rhodophyticola TaxID=3026423 RepID=A0ABY7YXG5_9HYPH|nr:hypothetical protein [Devosia rhodophyticola]WDR06051.1 hypothetical protein PSQ90_00885 [Devosia rhodophyticola]
MVVFDANTLMILIAPAIGSPIDSNGSKISHARERLDGLIDQLAKENVTIILPTPALSEALVRAGATARKVYIEKFQRHKGFRIESFDERAALEVARMTSDAIAGPGKRSGSTEPWHKIKYDRQIIAIAKVSGATAIYSDDKGLRTFAYGQGLNSVSLADLPIPLKTAQYDWVSDVEQNTSAE